MGAAQTRPPRGQSHCQTQLPGLDLEFPVDPSGKPGNGGEGDGQGSRDSGERWEEPGMRPTGGEEGMEQVGMRGEPRVL